MNSLAHNLSITSPPPVARAKKPKVPMALRVVRWAFPKLEAVAPRRARKWFVKLFFSPIKYPTPPQEQAVLDDAEKFTVLAAGKTIQAYTWGNDGPAILLVHGWSGRASQFRAFVPLLVQAGYRVVAFDGPAHGRSTGGQTTILEFKDAMVAIQKHTGPFHAAIAHSIGGAAIMISLVRDLKIDTVITLSTPSIGESILQEFALRINGSQRAIRHLRDHVWRTFGCSFDDLTVAHLVQQVPYELRLLIVHDENDKEASIEHAHHFQRAYPAATLLATRGLGHVRILRDESVINECVRFIGRQA